MRLALALRGITAATLVLAGAGCGSSTGGGTQPSTAPTSRPATSTQADPAPSQATTPEARPVGLLQDPCTALTADQVAKVLTDPGAGSGAAGGTGPGSGAACEWQDAAQTTFLEFLAYDLGAEDRTGLTADMLLQLRDATDSTLQVLDFAPAAIGGPEDGDAVVQWVGPGGLYQLRMYSVGVAADPASLWSTLQKPLQDLALAVNAAAG